jgi:hypothetical protein
LGGAELQKSGAGISFDKVRLLASETETFEAGPP